MTTTIMRYALELAASGLAAASAFVGAAEIDKSIGKPPAYRMAPKNALVPGIKTQARCLKGSSRTLSQWGRFPACTAYDSRSMFGGVP